MNILNPSQPIGIFDSGIGGLTVAHAITKLLPQEEIIYFGDTAHLPYGDKSSEAILHYSDRICEFLKKKGCKMIIIACNTASSVAYEYLQKVIGDKILLANVIDPVVEAVVADQEIKNVAIIGTKRTIQSNIYEKKLKELRPDLAVASLATPLLAPMIEEGFFDSNISNTVINAYLNYPDFAYSDAMILACTHYPLIKKEINDFFKKPVKVFDSTNVVAKYVKQLLEEHHLLNPKKNNPHHFIVSDYTTSFERTTAFFYKEEIKLEHHPMWD